MKNLKHVISVPYISCIFATSHETASGNTSVESIDNTTNTIEGTDTEIGMLKRTEKATQMSIEMANAKNNLVRETVDIPSGSDALPDPSEKLSEADQESEDAYNNLYTQSKEALAPAQEVVYETTSQQPLSFEETIPRRTDNAMERVDGDKNALETMTDGLVSESASDSINI